MVLIRPTSSEYEISYWFCATSEMMVRISRTPGQIFGHELAGRCTKYLQMFVLAKERFREAWRRDPGRTRNQHVFTVESDSRLPSPLDEFREASGDPYTTP